VPINSMASVAALIMSRTTASSRDIDRLRRAQDLSAPDPIRAALNSPASYQAHSAVQQCRKLILHGHVIKQSPLCIGEKGYQNVNIAMGAKIVSKSGAKQSQLTDSPASAKVGYLLTVNHNLQQEFLVWLHRNQLQTSYTLDKLTSTYINSSEALS